MRRLLGLACLLACTATGCHTIRECMFGPAYCPPAASPPSAPCPVETEQPAEVVRKKAPAAQVVVEVPEPTVVRAPQMAAPQAAPGMMQATPQGAVVMAAAPQMVATAAPQLATGQTVSTQTVSPGRTRLALAFDTFQIKLPRLRLVPFTAPSEVITTTQISTPPQQVVMPQTTMIQPPQYVVQQPQAAQQYVVQQPQAAPQYVVQQPQAAQQYVVQQPQAAPQYVVQQPQAAPQYVVQQPQATQQLMVQQPQVAQTQAAGADCPPVTKETLDKLQLEIDRTRAVLNGTQKAAEKK